MAHWTFELEAAWFGVASNRKDWRPPDNSRPVVPEALRDSASNTRTVAVVNLRSDISRLIVNIADGQTGNPGGADLSSDFETSGQIGFSAPLSNGSTAEWIFRVTDANAVDTADTYIWDLSGDAATAYDEFRDALSDTAGAQACSVTFWDGQGTNPFVPRTLISAEPLNIVVGFPDVSVGGEVQRVTIALSLGTASNTALSWNNTSGELPADWFEDNAARQVSTISVSNAGALTVDFSGTSGLGSTAAALALALTVGTVSAKASAPFGGSDTTDPYSWTPDTADDFVAVYKAGVQIFNADFVVPGTLTFEYREPTGISAVPLPIAVSFADVSLPAPVIEAEPLAIDVTLAEVSLPTPVIEAEPLLMEVALHDVRLPSQALRAEPLPISVTLESVLLPRPSALRAESIDIEATFEDVRITGHVFRDAVEQVVTISVEDAIGTAVTENVVFRAMDVTVNLASIPAHFGEGNNPVVFANDPFLTATTEAKVIVELGQ